MKRSTSAERRRDVSPNRVKLTKGESNLSIKERERQAELVARRKKLEKTGLTREESSKRMVPSKEVVSPKSSEENHTLERQSRSSKHISKSDSEEFISSESKFPYEISSGRLLTHYDETAGLAIPLSAVETHKTIGNTVIPLVESYRSRYDRLRALLTSKLFPRREQLLQIRRQLLHTSTEVAAVRKGIERETMKDAEQVIERLRAVESMRQSSITLQVLHLEEELESIERLAKRVEQAREENTVTSTGTGITLTSVIPGNSAIETIRAPQAALMVELIQQFSDLSVNIEKLATKPISVQVDFPVDDFPKETSERLEVISRCDRYIHALNVKDHMLWTSLQEKKSLEEKLEEEKVLTHEYAKEVANWAEIANTLSQELSMTKKQSEALDQKNKELEDILRRHNLYYAIPDSYYPRSNSVGMI